MPGGARGSQQEAEVTAEGKVEVTAWASLKKLLQGWRNSSATKLCSVLSTNIGWLPLVVLQSPAHTCTQSTPIYIQLKIKTLKLKKLNTRVVKSSGPANVTGSHICGLLLCPCCLTLALGH